MGVSALYVWSVGGGGALSELMLKKVLASGEHAVSAERGK